VLPWLHLLLVQLHRLFRRFRHKLRWSFLNPFSIWWPHQVTIYATTPEGVSA
jgi:hypothetical protein